MNEARADRPQHAFPEVRLLGVRIHAVTRPQLLRFIMDVLERRERAVLAYVNAHAVNLACDDPEFRAHLNRADLAFCDGYGVLLAARLSGQDVGSRNTPPDWIDELCAACCRHGYSLYFLGARDGVAAHAARVLMARHPGLRVLGTHHGYFDTRSESVESAGVVAAINASAPDILVVGLGMPAQERWIADHWQRLAVRVAIPVGALFDYVARTVPRGPRWMTDRGFEWLARLAVEPRRLWRRYLIGNAQFLWRVVTRGKT
jgi:N-acetylglucosaminyldiphosphoundecaprenol N-acetyl-beta-D-mannosaminyltransferase